MCLLGLSHTFLANDKAHLVEEIKMNSVLFDLCLVVECKSKRKKERW